VSAVGPGPGDPRADTPQNIATAIAEVSERATLLVHEEIELAKAEITEKTTKLVKGAIVGAAAGVFFLMALIFVLIGFAWLLYYYLPGNQFTYFWGFFAMAVILVVLGAMAGFIAGKAVKKGAPPVPTMAIAEAQKIREAVSAPAPSKSPASPPATSPPAQAPTPVPSSPPVAGAPTADAAFLAASAAPAEPTEPAPEEQPPAERGEI
jgi:uncharacterized membrane protein YqjE